MCSFLLFFWSEYGHLLKNSEFVETQGLVSITCSKSYSPAITTLLTVLRVFLQLYKLCINFPVYVHVFLNFPK